ncbi:hypothetical protein Tco_0925275 [Tanacetum coccineum]|uniref:Reverse transcriptase domain-containing protein n=1 Tax=Tanacetum coccineum TaxID=301880 RepID=A0ABQ5D6C7_9ASTR
MARMDAITMKMDARYKELQSRSNHPIPEYDKDEKPMYLEAEAKFMQTFRRTCFYKDYCDRDSNRGEPFLHTAWSVIRVKQKQLNIGVGTERMTFSIDSAMKHSYSNDDTCFSIDVIDEILKEDFNSLLDEGSKILYSIEGTIIKENVFAEFDEFIAMNIEENSESDSDKEIPFEKITL